jgi:hypothetical protein
MSNEEPTHKAALAQVRGILCGSIVFPFIALSLTYGITGALKPGPYGSLMAGCPDVTLRFGIALVAAVFTGFVTSYATRDYISGTSILGIGSGMLLLALGVARETKALGYTLGGIPSMEALLNTIIEIFLSLMVVLTAYFVAWQTDLHIVLPKRSGPPYQKKIVGLKELFGTNLTAFLVCGVLSIGISYTILELGQSVVAVAVLWFASCAIAALTARRFFAVRSTFFLWIAPGLALALISHEGLAQLLGLSLNDLTKRYCQLPIGLLLPLSVLATTAAYLMIPAPDREQSTKQGESEGAPL